MLAPMIKMRQFIAVVRLAAILTAASTGLASATTSSLLAMAPAGTLTYDVMLSTRGRKKPSVPDCPAATHSSGGTLARTSSNWSQNMTAEIVNRTWPIINRRIGETFWSTKLETTLPLPSNRRFWRALRELDDVVYRIIADRRHSRRDEPDLLSMFLTARDDETGAGMADYLESYAHRFQLPVRNGVRVDRLTRVGRRYLIEAGSNRFEADHVVVAMSSYQVPRVPEFARELRPDIVQMHSSEYRNLRQLKPGGVLLAGAGNSGAEIAIEVAREHPTWLAGRDTGHVPFRIDGLPARLGLTRLIFRVVFHRLLTVGTPLGRRLRRTVFTKGAPLIRLKPKQLAAAGVQRVARVARVLNGLPALEDGRVLDVANVIWCTGFGNGLSWINLPIFEASGEPRHQSGIAIGEPGLYFVGLHFLHDVETLHIIV